VLSRFAGAAQQMGAALLVNPYDGEEIADAMHMAREMRISERRDRHQALMRGLHAYDVRRWRTDFVAALMEAPLSRRGKIRK
jgi:trehalose 6-phosphate synthase